MPRVAVPGPGTWDSSELSRKPQPSLPYVTYLVPRYVTQSGWTRRSLEVLISFQGLLKAPRDESQIQRADLKCGEISMRNINLN